MCDERDQTIQDRLRGFCGEDCDGQLMEDAADEIDRLAARIETITDGVRYWSYCTDTGMRAGCPEKVEDLCDFFMSLHITPYSLRKK